MSSPTTEHQLNKLIQAIPPSPSLNSPADPLNFIKSHYPSPSHAITLDQSPHSILRLHPSHTSPISSHSLQPDPSLSSQPWNLSTNIDPNCFRPISPSKFLDCLNCPNEKSSRPDPSSQDGDTLVLDIRPFGEQQSCRIKNSVPISLPTALLKRPMHGLERIEADLEAGEDKRRLATYKTRLPGYDPQSADPLERATLARVVALDTKSISITTLNHPLSLLLIKFCHIGFTGDLCWLVGGFEAFKKLAGSGQWIVPGGPPSIEKDEKEAASLSLPRSFGGRSLRMSLSMLPSLTGSPTSPKATRCHIPSTPSNHSQPTSSLPSCSVRSKSHKRPTMSLSMLNPRQSTPNPTTPLAEPSTAQTLPGSSKSYLLPPSSGGWTNPFFDNIRQLNERLSLDVSLQNLSPIELPRSIEGSPLIEACFPEFLKRLVEHPPPDRAKLLARQFYDLELAEQRRLEDVMKWHSSRASRTGDNRLKLQSQHSHPPHQSPVPATADPQGGILASCDEHPFSISAGVELGYKNRYKNIWPWEHRRIKLSERQAERSGTDYVNASMIHFRNEGGCPVGMTAEEQEDLGQSYIATQGPLGSTFEDFWSMVEEQDVGLIVMLTRRHEAGREKCGDYLKNGQYGEVLIRTESDDGPEDLEEEERQRSDGDFFGFSQVSQSVNKTSPSGKTPMGSTIEASRAVVCKTVKMSLANRPDLPPRVIRHLQYCKWPDFDVPPAVDEVLNLLDLTCTESRSAIQRTLSSLQSHLFSSLTKFSGQDSDIRAEGLEDLIKLVGAGRGPILVHCSAGVGRTGSFILLDVMRKVLKVQCRKWLASPSALQNPGGSSPPTKLNQESEFPIGRNEVSRHEGVKGVEKKLHENVRGLNKSLPQFLSSELHDCNEASPMWSKSPVMYLVNEMREQRMSMVANYRQYVFLHEVLFHFLIRELGMEEDRCSPKTNQVKPASE